LRENAHSAKWVIDLSGTPVCHQGYTLFSSRRVYIEVWLMLFVQHFLFLENDMSFPSFFDQIPTITLRDPLAKFLGAVDDGFIRYSYPEVVKLTGHSCPTVAGAYLMTLKGLKQIYGDEVPERGAIQVEFRDSQQNGVTGVIANVVSFITGATTDNGFKGLGGNYDRRDLLFFEQPIDGVMRFQRLDTGAQATVNYNSGVVPASPEMMPALQQAMAPSASTQQKAQFAGIWQDRVRRIFESIDNPSLVVVA
jgi:hypothetical protein